MDSPQVVDGKKVWLHQELLTEYYLDIPYTIFFRDPNQSLRDEIRSYWGLIEKWEFEGNPTDMRTWARFPLPTVTLPLVNILQQHFSDLVEAVRAEEEGEAEKNSETPSTGRRTSKATRRQGSSKKKP